MAEKSFKKIRCVHAKTNKVHLMPEHLLTDEYLKDNELIVQEFAEGETVKISPKEVVEEKVVKAPKSKLVKN